MIGPLALTLLLTGSHGHRPPGVKWERNFEEALRKAKAAKKPILVDFWADWCGWCHRLDETTYVDPLVVRMSEDFIPVKLDTERGAKEAAIAARYEVASLPTIAFLTPSGRMVLRLGGFQGPGQFPRTLEIAKALAAKLMAWEAVLEKDPSHGAALMGLGVHLFEQEFYVESRDLLAKAVRLDGDLPVPDRKRSRMLLGIILNYERRYPESESLLREALGLRPAGEFEPKLLFVLGKNYIGSGRREDARIVLQEIVDSHSQSPVASKAREILVALDGK